MTRLFFGSLVGSLGASTFASAIMEEIGWLFGLSAAAIFVKADKP